MSADQLSTIMTRLDGLERQARGRRRERLLMLAVLCWLLASGPAVTALRARLQSVPLRAPEFSARAVLQWGWNEVRNLATIRPAVDPGTVLDDEREAFQEAAAASTLRAQTLASFEQQAYLAVAPKRSNGTGTIPQALSRTISSTPEAVATPAGASSIVAPAEDRDLGPGIREAERRLAQVSEGLPKLAGSLTGLAIPPPEAAQGRSSGHSVPANLPALQPSAVALPTFQSEPAAAALAPAAGSSLIAPAAAPPVSLKALGYAQSDDRAQAILTDGTTLYVVGEGEEFADRYRVTGIRPEGLDIEDRLAHTTFQLAFGH
jgi:hypothetical protein